ncbi:MAG: DUF2752 domain-containing protein [Lentisphaerae bacterium]|jgi:hypothetical protein|nr:DUF2752 domain-containing protein [Lentisphaerota bacterium]MBT4820846.1 DUF2752 domain-containing protein [Lentisphaerota bacterium]MBT5611404.1 DUF2752 domain-containing protein [Lentisphaerota bacterium]MBT7059632.1 DUF2752 domain-containing protein [Lentisphaerota bacterium]MBT7846861.1 DUF2752 domain-containing protein [Lentisphaerota bacterium]
MSVRPTAPSQYVGCLLLRPVAVALLCVYVAWNAFWLCHARLAPSLMVALTGLPAPTTGMTRSLRALVRGDLGSSLFWHPLAVPLLVLFGGSLLQVGWCLWRRHRLCLPEWVWRTWVVLLLLAWGTKFIVGRGSW